MATAKLPAGRVNEIPQILADPQIAARELVQPLTRSDGTTVQVLGFPGKFSATPADYRRAPPRSGEDSAAVLHDWLGVDADALAALVAAGVVAERL